LVDNRDGLAIKAVYDSLLNRTELHKILIVLSDGKPCDMCMKRPGIKSPAEIFLKKKPGTPAPKLTIPQMFYDDEWGKAETISAMDPDDDLYKACAAVCYAPSFLNLQPCRLIHDGNKIVLAAVMDEMTNAADAKLNLGIIMMHFEGVVSRQSSGFQGWQLEALEDYKLPENAYLAGYYQL